MTDRTEPENLPDAAPQQLQPLSPAREMAHLDRQRAMAETTFAPGIMPFSNGDAFRLACSMADRLAASTLLPVEYQGNAANVLVAIDYASRLGVSPIMMAQNMDVVKGRPGLRGAFLAALVNASPLFGRLRYEWRGEDVPGGEPDPEFGCRAYAVDRETGEVITGTWITWRMVKGEGWYKNDKWYNMREQMFQYRAASFWSRANASDITLGMHSSEELLDAAMIDATPSRAQLLEQKLDRREAEAVGADDEGKATAERDADTDGREDAPAKPEGKGRPRRKYKPAAPAESAADDPAAEKAQEQPEGTDTVATGAITVGMKKAEAAAPATTTAPAASAGGNFNLE